MLSLFHLPNQQKDEHTILFLRRHWTQIAGTFFLLGILLFIPLGLSVFFQAVFPGFLNGQLTRPLKIMFLSTYYLYIWALFFRSFVDYYLDTWIVTNKRILNIEQKGLFSRIISEQELSRIQDITSEIHGIFPTMFNYGNVHVQTAGAEQRFVFQNVSNPFEVRKRILKIVEKYGSHVRPSQNHFEEKK